jgi:hypothetical protein
MLKAFPLKKSRAQARKKLARPPDSGLTSVAAAASSAFD